MPEIQYQLIKSKRKTIAIQIRSGVVVVRAPTYASTSLIERIVQEKNVWIQKRLTEIKVVPRSKQFVAGESFLYLGTSLQLSVSDEYFRGVRFSAEMLTLSKYFVHKARAMLESWYKDKAFMVLRERLDYYSSVTGLSFKTMGISSAGGRWGSCSNKQAIRFSWRLVQLPLWVVDYVVIHELVHTRFSNHRAGFWNLVHTLCPKAQDAKKFLHSFHHQW